MILSDFLIFFSLILVVLGFALYLYFSLFSKLFFQKKQKTTPERASTFGEFINGLTGPIFALAGFLIIYATIMDQNDTNNIQHFESEFFKLLDYNRANNLDISIKSPKTCNEISGAAVWVSFYSQIKKAYQIIDNDSLFDNVPKNIKKDLAFATFFYGISKVDTSRLYSHIDKLNLKAATKSNYVSNLKLVEHCENWNSYFVGYTNNFETFLKQYFSFINYIDKEKTLTSEQKKEYINMLNLQNDNFCQLVIYYYFESSICGAEELKMKSKYNLLPRIDKSLLFHLNANTYE
jgi:hypothetical protein